MPGNRKLHSYIVHLKTLDNGKYVLEYSEVTNAILSAPLGF